MPLKRYAYDPLDRLTTTTMGAQPSTQRFYQRERLSTVRQGEHSQTVFQHHDQLLAEKHTTATLLLGNDLQRSVLHSLSGAHQHPQVYTPYGHHRGQQGLLGFNGEAHDPLTGHYLLGNGHRAYNPVLMRFNSPDTLSPFGKGGLNAYAYCSGDPVNRSDPSGQFSLALVSAAIGFAGALLGTQRSMGFMRALKKFWNKQPSFRAATKVATTVGTIGASGVTLTRLAMTEFAPNSVPSQLLLAGTALSGIAVAGGALSAALHHMKKGDIIWGLQKAPVAAVTDNSLKQVVIDSHALSITSQSSTLSRATSSQSVESMWDSNLAANIRKK
ncbi:RHS repeat-associated core domain-containing protein [Pseudomonas helleri]|uniref:RHS repeat-associated core domain-containing protein n=1 Tax=Pseudomonas helleri TaxID=1608996 RepID=UPI003FD689A4